VSTNPRVLIADDHAGITAWLSGLLADDCHVVGVVSDGGDVMQAAVRLQPVVIVVDLNLRNVNGLEISRQIVQQRVRARTIVITAMADEILEKEALQAGAACFFSKAAVDPALIAAIKQVWAEL
jgi:DNA-binding NarL/FixJ family response regulator